MRGTKQPQSTWKFFAPTLSEFCSPLFRPWAKSCIRPCPHINTVLYNVHAFWWGDCELNSSTFHYFVDKLLKYSSFLWGDCELSSSHSHYFSLCVRTGADTGFSSGGDKSGAKRPKNFLSPPELLRGGTEFCTLLRFCTIYIMSLQENIKKKIFVPPLNHSGGGHFGCPPPELLRRGTILRGGQSPPWNCSGGGQSPIPPPCIRSCIYIYLYINNVMVWSGPFKNNCHENVPLSPFLVNCPFNTDF